MSPEELYAEYEHLVKETLYKSYKIPYAIAKEHNIDFEDLSQYGRTGLWKACITYESAKSGFKTHAINNIKWHINERLKRECSIFKLHANKKYNKDEMLKVTFMESEVRLGSGEDVSTYHDILPSDSDTFEEAYNSMQSTNIFNLLDEKEKAIVLMKMKDASNREIGKQIGVTGVQISNYMKKIRAKVTEFQNREVAV